MCILNGEFPYDCTVYSEDELRASEGHDAIYEFDSSEIDNEERLKQICDNIKSNMLESMCGHYMVQIKRMNGFACRLQAEKQRT